MSEKYRHRSELEQFFFFFFFDEKQYKLFSDIFFFFFFYKKYKHFMLMFYHYYIDLCLLQVNAPFLWRTGAVLLKNFSLP